LQHLETLYAKENIQDEALNNLKAYIQRVCGCRAENAEKFVGEVLKHCVIPVDVAANILGDKNLELGKKYVDMLVNGGLVSLVNGKICLAVNFIQGLYRLPYEIIKPPVPIPGLPSLEKVKEGFIEALSYTFKDLFPCATIDKGDGEPWAVLLLKDVNVDWKGLTYYFACEDEKEFSLHLSEAQKLMVEKECHFILGYGLMEEGKLTKLLDGREGVFKFFSSSVTVPLNKQFFYIPATLKDIDDLQVLVSVGDEKRKKLVESIGLKDKFTKLKESLNMFLGGDIKEITPKFDPAHGYRYPEVETLVKGNFQKSLSFLEELTRAGILKRTLYDTVLFCPKCGSPHLSLRYKCPFCGSYDVGTTSLIEHVHCGNIAREEEYQKGAKMVCPKCHMTIRSEKDIRRVGFWYKCDSCGRNFEVPNMVLFCRMCKESFEHTEVKRVNVYSYSLQDLLKKKLAKVMGIYFLLRLEHTLRD
jgi:predicted RNA-binding Zn-ribbon protein involved in translation (DUF1610 family)